MFDCVAQALAPRGEVQLYCDLKTPKGPAGGFDRLGYRFVGKSPLINAVTNGLLRGGSAVAPGWLASPRSLDGVLDISGFAFSSQWGNYPMRAFLDFLRRLHPATPVVLLPQAFGPFEGEESRRILRRIFERCSLVCVRDRRSWAYLEAFAGDLLPDRARLYGDFTSLLTADDADATDSPDPRQAWIVPNYRMMDRTTGGDAYLAFLRRAHARLAEEGWQPRFLIHEQDVDLKVMDALGLLSQTETWTAAENGVHAKRLLRQAGLVVGSRFHALVSALSQAVPTIGLGWSHKYAELFAEYDSSDLLLTSSEDTEQFDRQLAVLSVPAERARIIARLATASERCRERSRAMWREVLAHWENPARLSWSSRP